MNIFLLLAVFIVACKKSTPGNPVVSCDSTVTDIDGNIYHTIKIGSQCWLKENLNVTKYRNGDPIPNITDETAWKNLTSGAYCNYDNIQSNSTTYGKLYNWHTIKDTRNLAPAGWHVPSDEEWTILTEYLGGKSVAGGAMKENSVLWLSPNAGATNSCGFTGLPAGNRSFNGRYFYLGEYGFFWTTTTLIPNPLAQLNVYYRALGNSGPFITRDWFGTEIGCSVRCVKD